MPLRLVDMKNHHGAEAVLRDAGNVDLWAKRLFTADGVRFGRRRLEALRDHISTGLAGAGWSSEVQLHPEYQLTIRSCRNRLAFHVQISGNASRLAYDLLKLQYLRSIGRIDAAIYGLPIR